MKSRVLIAALLWTVACADDDDGTTREKDAGNDSSTPHNDASTGDAGGLDGSRPSGDVDARTDAAPMDANLADTSVSDGGGDASGARLPSIAGIWFDEIFRGTFPIDATMFGDVAYYDLDEVTRTFVAASLVQPPLPDMNYFKVFFTPIANDSFYLCMPIPGAPTVEAARALTSTPDPTDLRFGCDGHDWSHFVRPLEISGAWSGNTIITSEKFGPDTVNSFDNTNNTLVLAMPMVPGSVQTFTYGKLVWTQPDAKNLYYCTLSAGFATPEEAKVDATSADPAQLTTGCKGAAWTHLTQP